MDDSVVLPPGDDGMHLTELRIMLLSTKPKEVCRIMMQELSEGLPYHNLLFRRFESPEKLLSFLQSDRGEKWRKERIVVGSQTAIYNEHKPGTSINGALPILGRIKSFAATTGERLIIGCSALKPLQHQLAKAGCDIVCSEQELPNELMKALVQLGTSRDAG
jgi:hypothetical protein